MSVMLIAPAVVLPVDLSLVKRHLRLEETDPSEDVLLTQLIRAAEGVCEQYQGRVYSKKSFTAFYEYAYESVKLPHPPLVGVSEVKLRLADGTEMVVPETEYFVDKYSFLGRVVLKVPSVYQGFELEPNGYQITFEAGYEKIPDAYAQAILLLVGHFYENRESASPVALNEIPFGVKALLSPDRVVSV